MVILVLAVLTAPAVGEVPPLLLVHRQTEQKPPPKPPRDDFDLLPKEAPLSPAALERQRELAKRRTMLQFHQIGGYLTLAGLTATAVLGQLDYLDKYGGGGDVGTYRTWHRWTAAGTTAVFFGTAALAVFAPSPIEKQTRLDTATLHKIAMTVAAAGMVTQIVLGLVTASKEGQNSQRDFALAHQIVGYTTLAASYAGFAVLAF